MSRETTIRCSRSSAIEADQAAERPQPIQRLRRLALVPLQVELRSETPERDQVDRSLADDLIRNVRVTDRDVSGFGNDHGRSLSRTEPVRRVLRIDAGSGSNQ